MGDAPMLLTRLAPGPALRPYVRALHAYAERIPVAEDRRELPVAKAVLIFNLGAPLWIGQSGVWGRYPDGLIGGLGDEWVVSSTRGERQAGIQAMLTPMGCQRLTGVAMHELANRSLPLEDVLGPDARRLVARLHETPSWRARLDAVEDFLLRRILDGRAAPPDVVYAWNRLEQTAGALRVADLARELRCSPRHLHGRFRDHVGLAPKRTARLLRFEHAAARLQAGEPLARVAAETGYSDQAHFSREVRELAGLPPAALLRERRSDPYKNDELPLA